MINMVFQPNLVPKCHLSRYLFSLSLSLSHTHTEVRLFSSPSLILLWLSLLTLSLMVETHVLPLPSCTLSLNQCYGDSWCSLATEESFYFCFWVWVSVCVWDCVPNIQGMFGRDPRASPPLVAADLSPLSLLFYFIFSLFLFCFGSSWFGSWSSYGLSFLMMIRIWWFFIWVWKVGFMYCHLQICGYFLIWSLSQNGSNMVFLLVYAYESVCMFGNLGRLGVSSFRICMVICVCLCIVICCSRVVWFVLKMHISM